MVQSAFIQCVDGAVIGSFELDETPTATVAFDVSPTLNIASGQFLGLIRSDPFVLETRFATDPEGSVTRIRDSVIHVLGL